MDNTVPPPVVKKPRPRPPGGSRKGIPNRATTEFKDTVRKLLEDNRKNVALWIEQIAQGAPAVLDEDGKVRFPARAPDPVQAVARLAALAEFAAPKLTRAEVTGEGGGALQVVIHKVA